MAMGTNIGGSPGVTYGPPNLSGTFPFLRGSGGGHGGVCNSSDTSLGGAGGGGIALIALGTINLSNGVFRAKGGPAQSSFPGDGGNAGGSGGAVMIVAPAFADAGAFYVLAGGSGGNAGTTGCGGASLGGGASGGGGRLTFITGSPSSGTLSLLPSLGGSGTGAGASGGTGGAAIPFGRPFVTLSAPNTGVAGSLLPFTATLAVGSASNYAWAFGDAGSANTPGSSTTHAYTTPGVYTLTVTATMSGTGILTSNSAVLTITEAPIEGLSAASSSPTLLGRTTYLSATISSGTNVTYTWSYGDGMSGGGADAQHVYPAPGIYTASVTATNSISTTSAATNVSVLWANYLPLIRR